jgi:uncharacterized protein
VVVAVHVQPRSGTTRVAGRHGDALRIRVAAPPVDGRATEAARLALAGALAVAPARVSLVSGERSRLKRFLVRDAIVAAVVARLDGLLEGP